jgi:hypothetical protein
MTSKRPLFHDDRDFTVLLRNLNPYRPGVSLEKQSDSAIINAKIADCQLRDTLGQIGPVEYHPSLLGVD